MNKRLHGQSQNTFLINHLRAGHTVTRLVALNLGIQNLTARLADIRGMGYPVHCEWKRDALGGEYGSFSMDAAVPQAWAA